MSGPVCRHIVRRTGQVCGRLVQYEDNACGLHTQLTVNRSHQHRRHGHGASSSGSGRRRRREPMGTQQQQPARSVRTRTTAENHHPIPPTNPCPHRRRVHDLLHGDGARAHSLALLWPCLPRRVYRCVGEHGAQLDLPIVSSADPHGHPCHHTTSFAPSALLRRLRPPTRRPPGSAAHSCPT